MIRIVNKTCKVEKLYSPMFTKIISEYDVFGCFDDVELYEQTDEQGNLTSLMLNNAGSVTLFANEGFDGEEATEFLGSVCCKCVLSNVRLNINWKETTGAIMKYSGQPSKGNLSKLIDSEEIKDIFSLMKDSFEYVDDFSLWYCDISHKIRHNSSIVAGIRDNGKIISCASGSYITEDSAVVCGVCTDKQYMSRGYASDCVKQIVFALDKRGIKHIYDLCKTDLISFYIKNGFEVFGEWYEYLREV